MVESSNAGHHARAAAGKAALASRCLLLGAVCLMALLAGTRSASALIVHLQGGATVSYQPAPSSRSSGSTGAPTFDGYFTNLDYNGGPVMPSNTNYVVYWAPPGAPAYPSDYKPGVNRFFEDLAHDSGGHENVDSVSAQYNDSSGAFASYSSSFGGALTDEDPYPVSGCPHAPKCLTDQQIRAELVQFVSSHHLPMDLGHEYFLLTPEGVEDCIAPEQGGLREACSANVTDGEFAAYCAYHGNIGIEGGGELIYSNDPFVFEKNCDEANHPNGSSDSALIGGLSHEHNESITDPEPNSAWTDWGGETGEIGDKCRTLSEATEYGTPLGTAANGAKYNQLINGHLYWYQQEWSNQTHRCLQRFAPSGEAPSATFTSEPLTGTEMRFDATGSEAGPGVRYSWQFNDAAHAPSNAGSVETTALSVTHTFPASERFRVALTVLRSDGTSAGAARTIAVGDEGPSAALTTPGAAARLGGAVQFDGSGSADSDGSITSYSWNFGDGTTASGVRPSHPYAAAGSYAVTLTVTDATGQTTAASRAVSVLRQAQTVAFTSAAPGGARVAGAPYGVAALASSGLAVALSSASPAVCSLAGSTVSFNAPGTCTIDASQAGDARYEPAPLAQQSFDVAAAAPAPSAMPAAPGTTPPALDTLASDAGLLAAPDSTFTVVSVAVNRRTGAITFTESVAEAGTIGWRLTFANGSFGAFSASATRCKPHLVLLRGGCRPARVVFAEGSRPIALSGYVSFVARPGNSATRALRYALDHGQALSVSAALTFRSALGGTPVTHTRTLSIRPRR